MTTPTHTYQNEVSSGDQGRSDAPRDLPFLLWLLEQTEGESQEQVRRAALAEALARLVEQRLPVSTGPLLSGEVAGGEDRFAERTCAELTTRLQQGFRRLVLIPWGARQHLGSLPELAERVLITATGEPVSLTELTLPHVHVDGLAADSAFEGYRSIQAQLGPLLNAFPAWDRTWVRLAAGNIRIVLLRTSEWTEQLPRSAAWEKPTVKALTAALDPQRAGFMTAGERSRWQRDGEIYARYLVALLYAAADFLMREEG